MLRSRSVSLSLALLALAAGCSSKSSAPASADKPAPDGAAGLAPSADVVSADAEAAAAPAGAKLVEEEPAAGDAEELRDEQATMPARSRTAADKDDALAPSRVEIAEPMINGGLNRDIIRRKAQDHEDDIRACHAKALAADPELFGSLALELKVDERGVVKDVSLAKQSELDERELVDCVLALVSTWSFADATGKAEVELRFEFGAPG